MIEIEKRSLITKKEYKNLTTELNKITKKVNEVKRFTLVKVESSNFRADPNNLTDIKIRTTKKQSLFTIKHGNWHNSSGRKENEIHFDKKEINELIEMLISLGFKYFVAMYVTRTKYELENLVVTIDKYHHMEDILVEVEMVVESDSELYLAESEIDNFLNRYNLSVLDSKGTISFIDRINLIKETRVDFSKIAVSKWVDEWKDFINCKI